MSSVPFHYIDLRAFCYVTENEQRVEDALGQLLPAEFELDRAESAGHYGDPILVLSARVESQTGMQAILDGLRTLPDGARNRLDAELDERVDEDCSFFVSLDKQAAAGGAVCLGDGISLRAKVEAYPAKRESAIKAIRSAGVV